VILSGPDDLDLTAENRSRREAHLGLGFRRGTPAKRAGVELRRFSGDFWSTERARRDAGRRGDLDRLVSVLDCFLQRRRRAAGAAQVQVSFG
jgi:hypothetical protein